MAPSTRIRIPELSKSRINEEMRELADRRTTFVEPTNEVDSATFGQLVTRSVSEGKSYVISLAYTSGYHVADRIALLRNDLPMLSPEKVALPN